MGIGVGNADLSDAAELAAGIHRRQAGAARAVKVDPPDPAQEVNRPFQFLPVDHGHGLLNGLDAAQTDVAHDRVRLVPGVDVLKTALLTGGGQVAVEGAAKFLVAGIAQALAHADHRGYADRAGRGQLLDLHIDGNLRLIQYKPGQLLFLGAERVQGFADS